MFYINTTVRTGVCSGLKEWHLLSIGEGVISFDVILGAGGIRLMWQEECGDQCYAETV